MIAAIERAITQALADASAGGLLPYGWRTLDSYPDDFDAYLKEKGQLRTPAAWAVFLAGGDGRDNGDDDIVWSGQARFALVVADKNLRGETATRHGGTDAQAEPGSYRLAEDAIRVLSGSVLGLDLVEPVNITGMRLVARSPEIRTQGLSLIAIELTCRFPIGPLADVDDLGGFDRLHADWDVPPRGNVTPPLPAEEADAQDLMELPQ